MSHIRNLLLKVQIRRYPNIYRRNISNSKPLLSGDIIDSTDIPNEFAPKQKERPNENLEQKKARLLYQSRKRGMLENGLLLSTFAARYLDSFDANQCEQYDKIINGPSNDWDLFYWATSLKDTPSEYENEVMRLFKEHVKNARKERRIRQPDLP